ncbi:Methyltransferase-like protein 7A like protein [Argiope bruennichi]|uniref:Methyltransferase-like protein 7A like protein n=1 Tax=Argiope bruennichi TaxID=94029 RepID=A0A8T0EJ41_ARGBR|nr:Methyltransferase-like protein 7A like protein [Argiope bruennichi]
MRECIFYTTVTIAIWALSLSWLFPLLIVLKFSQTCRDKWFSWLLVRVSGPLFKTLVDKQREKAFDLLKEHLGDKKRKTPLEILEIGVGGGDNLQFYPENANLTVLDSNESFIKYFEENRQKYPQVNLKNIIIAWAEDMHEVADESFDILVCTLVLCSVKDVQTVLKEVKRVLKPGGKFLFWEHIMYPSSSWNATLQRLLNPLWKIYFDGCNINRKLDEEIRKAGFSDLDIQRKDLERIWIYVRPQIIGVATK